MGITDFSAARPAVALVAREQLWDNVPLPEKADIAERRLHVR
jgi:hypothetical protein